MTLARLGREGAAYALALLGALAAWALNLPLAFLVGPVVTMSVVSQRLPKLQVSRLAYALGLAVIGVGLGQYFTPETLDVWSGIAGAIALNTAITLTGIFLGFLLLSRVFGHDRRTAALAGLPGGILTVIEMARASNADTSAVLFFQVFRIVLGASLIPLGYAMSGFDVPTTGVRPVSNSVPATLHDLALLIGGSLIVMVLGRRLRIPSAEISLPLALSATLYATGVVTMTVPVWLVAGAFVVVGASVGTLLPRLKARLLLKLVLQTAVLFALFMALTFVAAFFASALFGLRPAVAILAFSPASLTEMIAVALALELDPAFVAANNMYRMLFCSVLAPFLPWLVLLCRPKASETGA
ncbi:AbrB family transcriptional regulator [Palleronia caenipelagi]|uniref:AbrB family transcriptional regulator n=1 Tax=Palleronia caenipelagi TaxID=2489174 RepID=A0A547PL64_9RHOB|nr:AbrB family transcriptional regulator [Palleronia caenipelagi]TRD14875.1 AbrB family transcriptional regulator [Palleronia caenipelagi]